MSTLASSSLAGAPKGPASKPSLSLNIDVLGSFKPARVFKDAVDNTAASSIPPPPHSGPLQVTSIAFDDSGERCLTSGEDEVFTLYDAWKGKKLRSLYSKKYGIAHARFSHRRENIIHASTKGDNAIRYHSMHDNKYLSYFQGHTAMVRSLQMNPMDDTFLSAGDDGTVRLWDLRTPTCRGLVNDVGGSTIAAFDSSGVVFAVACSSLRLVMLFDSTSLDDAPFAHATLVDPHLTATAPQFTSLVFSNDGQYIVLGTATGTHYVLNAYDLSILRRLDSQQPGLGRLSGEEVCWTADSKWVLSGCPDGAVAAWDLTPPDGTIPQTSTTRAESAPTLQPTALLRPGGDGLHAVSRAVRFNPRYGLLAVGGEELALWLPAQSEEEVGES